MEVPVEGAGLERPTFVAVYVSLGALLVALLLIQGLSRIFANYQLIIGAVMVIPAIAAIAILIWLWQMKNWARVAVIVLSALVLLGALSLVVARGGEYAVAGALAVIVAGFYPAIYPIWWLARHRAEFD